VKTEQEAAYERVSCLSEKRNTKRGDNLCVTFGVK
jgi:hypothetical protein